MNNRISNFLYIIFFSNTCSNIAIVILIFKMHTLSCFFRKQINFRVQTFCEISTFRLLAACFLSTLPSNLLKCSLRQHNSPPAPHLPLETCVSGLVLSLSSLDRTFPSKKPGYGPATYILEQNIEIAVNFLII